MKFILQSTIINEQLTIKRRNTTIAFNNNSATNEKDTITDSGSAFLTSGFRTGDVITVSGATNSGNNTTFSVYAITAGTITLTESGVLTTEAAGATVKIVSSLVVTDGIAVVVKAKSGNAGNIFLSDRAEGATSGAGFILRANESISLQVNRTEIIYLDAVTSGEGVEVLLESGLQGS